MKIYAALLAAIMLSTTAYAAQITKTEYKRDERLAVIEGNVSTAGSTVTFELLRPGYEWTDIENSFDGLKKLAYFDEVTADDKGNFSFSFEMHEKTGIYPIRVYSRSDEMYCYDDAFKVLSQEDIEKAVKKAIEASSVAEIELIFEPENADLIGLDINELLTMDASERIEVLEYILTSKNEKTWKIAADIQESVSSALLVRKINSATSAEEIKELMTNNIDLFVHNDESSYAIFANNDYYNDKRRLEVYKALLKTDYKTVGEIRKSFDEAILLCSCYHQENYHIIGKILGESKIIKLYDTGKYFSLNDKTTVHKTLNACILPYSSMTDLANEIKAVADANPQQSNLSGGDSSNHSTGSMGILIPQETDNNVNNKNEISADNSTVENKNENNTKTKSFLDMDNYSWAKEAVYYLRDKGIVSGKSETNFAPGEMVSREEFLQMLIGIVGSNTAAEDIKFDDTDSSMWYYNAVKTGVSLAITNGISSDKFGIGMPITRQDMTVMICRAFKLMGIAGDEGYDAMFADEDDIADYARASVHILKNAGIINGIGDGRFEPSLFADRASAAVIVYRVLQWRK